MLTRLLVVQVLFWGALAIGETSKRGKAEAEREAYARALLDFQERLKEVEAKLDGAIEIAAIERARLRPDLYDSRVVPREPLGLRTSTSGAEGSPFSPPEPVSAPLRAP